MIKSMSKSIEIFQSTITGYYSDSKNQKVWTIGRRNFKKSSTISKKIKNKKKGKKEKEGKQDNGERRVNKKI